MKAFTDACRAVQFVRYYATSDFTVYSTRIVVCGFGSGGHLVRNLTTDFAKVGDDEIGKKGANPNYAVILDPTFTETGATGVKNQKSFSSATCPIYLAAPTTGDSALDLYSLSLDLQQKGALYQMETFYTEENYFLYEDYLDGMPNWVSGMENWLTRPMS